MKLRYILLFLILALIFNLGLACGDKQELKKQEIKTIDVKYIVGGVDTDEVSVTYSNSQGGTEQKNNLKLKNNLEEAYRDTNFNVKIIKDVLDYERCKATVVAHYKEFPIDGFLYISAQNQNDHGRINVQIVVNNLIWKSSKAEGEYCITDASGYYDK